MWSQEWKLYKKLSSFLIHGANKDTTEEHIHCVGTEGTCAMQVDVAATATVFEIPVYFCVKTRGRNSMCQKLLNH